ncbi:MAG TPA: CvpA family protein [Casimicrobiaceae bacterium]|nr:CvpA family protein [Casimicrobiaceae bacterium]
MSAFDLIVIGIVGLSAIFAFWRGLIRVVVSLVGLVAAVLAAIHFSPSASNLLLMLSDNPATRYLAAFALIFIVVVLMCALLGWVLSRALRAIGLGFVDRLLGAVFGVARGVLIVVIAVLLAGLTTLPRQEWWQNALFAPPLVIAALSLRPWLPQALAQRLDYGPGEAKPGRPAKTRVQASEGGGSLTLG